MHLVQALRARVVGLEVSIRERPSGALAVEVRNALKVVFAQPKQRRAVELGVAADPEVGERIDALAGPVQPLLARAVAAAHHDFILLPVFRLAREKFPAFEQQDTLAGLRQALRERAAPGAGAHDDHVPVCDAHGPPL